MVPCTGESPPTGQVLTEQAAIFSSNLREGVSPPKMNASPKHKTPSKLKGELTHELSQLWRGPGRERQIL
jgi:hypothetical protein